MKVTVLSLVVLAAAASGTKYSTVYQTEVYTITSCAPTVSHCAIGYKTSTVHTYVTTCTDEAGPHPTPVSTSSYDSEAHTSPYHPPKVTYHPHPEPSTTHAEPYTTSTVYMTHVYTITSCAPTVIYCPVGQVTTTVITSTTVCPISSHPTPIPGPSVSSQGSYQPPQVDTTKSYTAPIDTPKPNPPSVATLAPYQPPISASKPILSTLTISTCIPTVIYSIITVSPVASTSPISGEGDYPGVTSTYSPYPTLYVAPHYNNDSTVEFHGSASQKRAGLLLIAAGLAVAIL